MRESTVSRWIRILMLVALSAALSAAAEAQQDKPNILVIWGDDIGVHNISAYNHGIMGYKTPNIDRLAKEGALFTDLTPSSAALPGAPPSSWGSTRSVRACSPSACRDRRTGIPDWAPTIADLLKPQGYATGQFGKNHLGDRDKHLPTVHGFDEFFGNLYHLNAEEEPEAYYYPKDPEFRKEYGPRGVLHTWSDGSGAEDRGHRPADAKAHAHRRPGDLRGCENSSTTPSSQKKPFFVWFNTTRMHVWTHLKKESPMARPGIGLYPGRHGRA